MHSPILLIEDDAEIRSLLLEALTGISGFLVHTVETAGAAQALMEGTASVVMQATLSQNQDGHR